MLRNRAAFFKKLLGKTSRGGFETRPYGAL